MTIYEQINEILKNRKGEIVTKAELVTELKNKYGTKSNSVFLSDYCYNRMNEGIRFNKHIFEFLGGGEYKYLGPDYPYSGKIFHKPQHQEVKEVGEWINGVIVSDPVSKMIEKYKAINRKTKNVDEIYKWQLTKKYHHRPNIKAEDFTQEYKSIDYSNLIYYNAKGVGNHIAKDRTEKFREQFKNLFDESIDLQTRVTKFNKETLSIYREIWPKETDSHHQDERTISTYLAYYDANKYPFYKSSFYRKYCKLIGEDVRHTGEKYLHYIQLLDDLIANYILPDKELLELKASCIPEDAHEDASHYILAQDILYQMLDQNEENDMEEKTKYWLYAPGESAEMWDEFYNLGIMGLGWDKLGDLAQYDSKDDIVKKLQELGDTTSSKKNDATANFEFKEVLSIGDIIIAKKGRRELLGYGEVTSDYYYDETRDRYKKCRKVKWSLKGTWHQHHNLPIKTLTDITKYPTIEPAYSKWYEYLMAVINDEYEFLENPDGYPDNPEESSISLNTILYGPPGTGKTYYTVDLAVKIAAPDSFERDNHMLNKKTYDELVNQGQLVFTTFHQSMCYEDFVEGIKPEPPNEESDNLTYDIKDGIFKQIATNALFEYVGKGEGQDLKGTYSFNEAFSNYINTVKESLENNEEVWLKTRSGLEIEIIDINDRENISLRHKDKEKVYLVSKRRLEKLYTEIEDFDAIGNINEEFRRIIGGCNSSAYWAVLNMLQAEEVTENKTITPSEIDYESKKLAVEKLKSSDIINDNLIKKYVLIIDEINRGNVSQILGELITLIEDDKRFGLEEGIEVILPYSKSRFVIPPNLYIIGTMNTADRSVEALDTALRRRFSFLEMMPKYDLPLLEKEIEGISLSLLLETINYRIEKILDRDHQIGHSYLLRVNDASDLQLSFKDKIIPLLQEYFYGDYEKLGLILGTGFIGKNGNESQRYADFPVEDLDIYERPIYEIKEEPFKSTNEFIKAIDALLNITAQ